MAGPFTKTAVQVFAGTDAAGKARQVNNHDAQVWGSEVERMFALFQAGGGVVFTSKAEADANLDYAANTMAWVTGDDDEAGLYQKQGASGGGSWVRVGDLPYSFIRAENVGAGTANAIQATTVDPIPQADGGALIALPIAVDNTASPVTVSFNGGPALTIKTIAGNDVPATALAAGMIVWGFKQGDEFRLATDLASAGILSGAEEAALRAEDAADAVSGIATTVIDPQFPTKAIAEQFSPAFAPDYIRTAGYAAAGDGGGALYKKVSAEPAHSGKLSITLDDGVTVVWYEISEEQISPDMLGAAGDGSTDDTTPLTDIDDMGGGRLGRGKTYLTTLDDLAGGFEGPGNIILANPPRAYSPRRIEGRKLAPPDGFGWTPEILPYFSNGRWRGHISALSLFPDVDGATYYVDAATGNDGNDGTVVSPLASITAALEKSDVGEVLVAPVPVSIAHENRGLWGNPTVITSANHVIVRPWNIRAGRPVVARAANHQESDWTPNGTNPHVYTFSLSTEPTAVLDLAGGLNGEPVFYTKVGLINEAASRPGSWGYTGSSEVFVNPINYGVPSGSIKILRSGTCGYWPSNKALYVDGMDFIGGTEGFEIRNQSCDVILTNCRSLGANNNGFSINTAGLAILESCQAGYNRLDDFNYHKPSGFAAGHVIEINCGSLGVSGVGLSLNNQISTIHDGVKILRIGSDFGGSGDQVISDVNAGSMAWNVGLRLGASRDESSRNTGYELSDGAEGWLYDCDLGHSAVQLLVNGSTARLHNTLPASYTATGSGVVEAYVQT